MGLILSQLQPGERVFIDTNIFLYAVFEHSAYGKSCRDFLKRVEKDELLGFASDLVLNEVFHKLMDGAFIRLWNNSSEHYDIPRICQTFQRISAFSR